MGRGRAKAKQTKVARALKYHSHDPDLAALQRELAGRASDPNQNGDHYDEYADEVDDEDDADEADDGRWATRHAQ